MQLMQDMDIGRRSQLLRLGFNKDQAAALSALHTKSFMLKDLFTDLRLNPSTNR